MATKAKKTVKITVKRRPAGISETQTAVKGMQQATERVRADTKAEYSVTRLFEKVSTKRAALLTRRTELHRALSEVQTELNTLEVQLQAYQTILKSGLHGALTL